MKTISSIYTKNGIMVPSKSDADSLYQDGFGTLLKDPSVLLLVSYETLFLTEKRKLIVIDEESREKLVFQELLNRFSIQEPFIWTKYLVYRDLRSRGFVVKESSIIEIDFFVYERGAYGKKIPKYSIFIIWEGKTELIRNLSIILDTIIKKGKILRIAVVDRQGEVVYYTLSEINFF